MYIVYIGHRRGSRQGGFPLPTALTPVSHGTAAPSNEVELEGYVQARLDKHELSVYRNQFMNSSTRQQQPQSNNPPSQYPQYMPPNSNFAPGGGDAQHQGHTDPGSFVSHYPAYPLGGRQTEFSAQHDRASTNAHLQQQLQQQQQQQQLMQQQQQQQMPISLGQFSTLASGYNSATNSTARETQRAPWPDGATQPPPFNPEPNA